MGIDADAADAMRLLERARAALEEAAPEGDALRVASLLRGHTTADVARAAAELHELRVRAERKFPSCAPAYLTRVGLEQASHAFVARFRAAELGASAGPRVLDATCGIGGDALALAAAGALVVAADLDPLHARLARANLVAAGLRACVVRADAARPPARPDALVVDPDRRAAGRRSLDPTRWSPTLAEAVEAAHGAPLACIKLPPAFAPDAVAAPDRPHRWQWVSVAGELREVALWLGEPRPRAGARAEREAVVIDAAGAVARLALPADAPAGRRAGAGVEPDLDPRSVAPLSPAAARAATWIAEPDPAVVRAGLVGALARASGLAPLDAHIAYLGGDAPPAPSPFLRRFRVLGVASADRRRVRALLAEHDVGPLVVKKRGHPESADALARRLRGRGARTGTLIVTRLADGHAAFLVEPLPAERAAPGAPGVGDEGFEPPTSSL